MRKIYLVRHGRPDFPAGETMCIGTTELPLSTLGHMQAYLAAERLRSVNIGAVYSSPLARAVTTAGYTGVKPVIDAGLAERYAGDWEGLSFSEIRQRWPELYRARGEDASLPMPNAETDSSCIARFEAALLRALEESRGDIAVFSHRSVCCAWLGKYSSLSRSELRERLDYCSISVVAFDGGFRPLEIGGRADVELTRRRCERLLEIYGTPPDVRAHCSAVAELAEELCSKLGLDSQLCLSAAMLHDIARTERSHPETGAELLERLGYPAQADIIRRHHELGDTPQIDEAAVVYIADKLVCGSERVSLETRFSQSAAKCLSAEALAANRRRYAQAITIKTLINDICGGEIIK